MSILSTKYLGLDLKNPIIAASSGLTGKIDYLIELENAGVSAIVLKSLFEEDIIAEINKQRSTVITASSIYPEIYDAFTYDEMVDSVSKYINLIKTAKSKLSIPIIASINCVSANEWTTYAKKIQDAGADALELNMFIMPSDFNRTSEENEKVYFDVIEKVKSSVSIPIALKISYHFSNLANMIKRLSDTGIDGLVLFNRYYNPDIDIDNIKVIPGILYSKPSDIHLVLRWIAIAANRINCSLAATTGIHDGASVIKMILAGADVVQIASTIYYNEFEVITNMLNFVKLWMSQHDFESINEFRGILSQSSLGNPAAYERVQFMKHFAGKLTLG